VAARKWTFGSVCVFVQRFSEKHFLAPHHQPLPRMSYCHFAVNVMGPTIPCLHLAWLSPLLVGPLLPPHTRRQECIKGIGPEYGWASFDNIGTASLTVFTIIALEGWTEILYVPVLSGWSIALCTSARVQMAGCDVRGVCAELQITPSPLSTVTLFSLCC
jgi:hypothetical protein